MLGRVVNEITNLWEFMAWSAGVALLFSVAYRISLRLFKWRGSFMKLHGLFMGLSILNQVQLSLLYLRCSFVVWCLLARDGIELSGFMILIILGVCLGLLTGKPIKLLEELANTALQVIGFYVGGMLLAYMREVRFDWGIMWVYILLGCFMTTYCLYFFVRDIKNFSQERLEINVKV